MKLLGKGKDWVRNFFSPQELVIVASNSREKVNQRRRKFLNSSNVAARTNMQSEKHECVEEEFYCLSICDDEKNKST